MYHKYNSNLNLKARYNKNFLINKKIQVLSATYIQVYLLNKKINFTNII